MPPAHDPRPRNTIAAELCAVGRRGYERGLFAGSDGNISVRVAPDRVLITPTNVCKGTLDPATLVVIDLDGRPVDVPAGSAVTSEQRVHTAIYRRRPDAVAVVHTHSPHATAFCVARAPLPTDLHPEAAYHFGHVPLVPYLRPGTDALADAVAAALGDTTAALLMASHGPVTLGASLLDAYHRAEMLEHYCHVLSITRRIAEPVPLTADELRELRPTPA